VSQTSDIFLLASPLLETTSQHCTTCTLHNKNYQEHTLKKKNSANYNLYTLSNT